MCAGASHPQRTHAAHTSRTRAFLVGCATLSTWILTDLFGIARRTGSSSPGAVHLGITLAVAVIVLTGASRVARRLSVGGLEGMLDGVRPRDDAHIAALRDETLLLDRLIDDLRTVALAEVGALTLHREDVQPAEAVDAAVAAFRAGAEAAGVPPGRARRGAAPDHLGRPCPAGRDPAEPARQRLQATPAGGEVEAAVSAADARTVAFTVRDTGAGLGEGEAERIFDRYHRAADSTGSGLGLTIAREIVAAHGGTVAAASDGPGRGTTVWFTIPAAG